MNFIDALANKYEIVIAKPLETGTDKGSRTRTSRVGECSTPLKFILSKGLIPRSAKILDFGCGAKIKGDNVTSNGDVEYLRKLGFDCDGYDPFPAYAGKDKKTGEEKTQSFADKHLYLFHKLPNKKYDIITCTYVLNVRGEEDRKKILSQIRSRLKPNGKAFVSVRKDVSSEGQKGAGGCIQQFIPCPEGMETLSGAAGHFRTYVGKPK